MKRAQLDMGDNSNQLDPIMAHIMSLGASASNIDIAPYIENEIRRMARFHDEIGHIQAELENMMRQIHDLRSEVRMSWFYVPWLHN